MTRRDLSRLAVLGAVAGSHAFAQKAAARNSVPRGCPGAIVVPPDSQPIRLVLATGETDNRGLRTESFKV